MEISFQKIKNSYDIVIIGAGISGITLAKNITKNKNILLVEAGGRKYSRKQHKNSFSISKNLGNWPVTNYASYFSRLRLFGGNSIVWGGWCMQLDDYDFENNEIWKLLKENLILKYKAAEKSLKINQRKIIDNDFKFEEIKPYIINISEGSFSKLSFKDLKDEENIDVVLNTQLKNILFKDSYVSSILLKDDFNNVKEINMSELVIAAGGIESTKILMKELPDKLKPKSLGKYFMEHPQLQIGRLKTSNKQFINFIENNSPPTIKHLFDDKKKKTKKKYFSGYKTNSTSRNYFVLRSSNVYQSKTLYRLRQIVLTKSLLSTGKIKIADLLFLTVDVLDMFRKKLSNIFKNKKSYSIVAHFEQLPDARNQIYFDNDENLVLDWKLMKNDLKNIKQSIDDITNSLNKLTNTEVEIKKELLLDSSTMIKYLNKNLFGIGHHMGTTRMGLDASSSVCDINFKVHTIDNLYVNSTSLFPTGGIANPTLTLVSLTHMLADTLSDK